MKYLSAFILTLFYTSLMSQVHFNSNRAFCKEADFVLIPTLSFSYSLKKYEFITHNTNRSPEMKQILPEIYGGCQLVADGFAIGAHYGFLQQTIMLSGGFTIPLKAKKSLPKK